MSAISVSAGRQTSRARPPLVASLEGQILLAGDIAYLHGSMANFRDCFEPQWGRFRNRWRAVPGNHEYETANADDYYSYFGDASGVDNTGFYSFMAGDWLILMLNSNIPAGRNSAQWEFVRRQIDQQRTPCTMAVWHHPLFSSGPNGNNANMKDLWALLEAAPIEVILNGHDHLYERFARQMSDGTPEPAKGVREFIVGTGGADLYGFVRTAANSEVADLRTRRHAVHARARAVSLGVSQRERDGARLRARYLPVGPSRANRRRDERTGE